MRRFWLSLQSWTVIWLIGGVLLGVPQGILTGTVLELESGNPRAQGALDAGNTLQYIRIPLEPAGLTSSERRTLCCFRFLGPANTHASGDVPLVPGTLFLLCCCC
jgi:hypothetical protein